MVRKMQVYNIIIILLLFLIFLQYLYFNPAQIHFQQENFAQKVPTLSPSQFSFNSTNWPLNSSSENSIINFKNLNASSTKDNQSFKNVSHTTSNIENVIKNTEAYIATANNSKLNTQLTLQSNVSKDKIGSRNNATFKQTQLNSNFAYSSKSYNETKASNTNQTASAYKNVANFTTQPIFPIVSPNLQNVSVILKTGMQTHNGSIAANLNSNPVVRNSVLDLVWNNLLTNKYPINAETNTNFNDNNKTSDNTNQTLPLCLKLPPTLVGNSEVSLCHHLSLADIGHIHRDIALGGHYKPAHCQSKYKIAIIVPYRDREEHLRVFLLNILPFLKRQEIDFNIFVIEQGSAVDDEPFNRAMLFNVGFVEANKRGDFDCFIFHDVDLIPENDYNSYSCPEQPRHMSVAVDKFDYKLFYDGQFGGVSALTKEHFIKVNGFSNSFWGWGAEDDDMAQRIADKNLTISRPSPNFARYKMIKHKQQKANKLKDQMLQIGKLKLLKNDGLASLKYSVEQVVLDKLYTLVRVQLSHILKRQ